MKVSGETRVMNGLVEVKHEPIIINNNNNLHHNNNGFISNGLHVTKKVVQKSLLGEEGHKNDLTYLHHQQQVSLRPVTTSIQPKIVSQQQQQQRSTTTSPNGESQPTFQKHTHNEELSTCSFIYFFHNKQSFELEKFLNGFVVLSPVFLTTHAPVCLYFKPICNQVIPNKSSRPSLIWYTTTCRKFLSPELLPTYSSKRVDLLSFFSSSFPKFSLLILKISSRQTELRLHVAPWLSRGIEIPQINSPSAFLSTTQATHISFPPHTQTQPDFIGPLLSQCCFPSRYVGRRRSNVDLTWIHPRVVLWVLKETADRYKYYRYGKMACRASFTLRKTAFSSFKLYNICDVLAAYVCKKKTPIMLSFIDASLRAKLLPITNQGFNIPLGESYH